MSSATTRRPLAEAQAVADEIVAQLTPHCERIGLAGSIRRQRPTIGDIEIVCIPRPYESAPLLRSGIALVVEQWEKVRGELPCKYTQRLLPRGMKLDLFMPDPRGYGLQLAIRTGSADWCRQVLAPAWVRAGYRSKDGLLRDPAGRIVPTPDERDLFRQIGLRWVEPVDREVQP
jgi:DNA polymerase/3'-5' exonuclease PolX